MLAARRDLANQLASFNRQLYFEPHPLRLLVRRLLETNHYKRPTSYNPPSDPRKPEQQGIHLSDAKDALEQDMLSTAETSYTRK